METLSHTIGRDPVMDRAVARVAQSLADFEHTLGTDVQRAELLAVCAKRLWGATARLHDGVMTSPFAELRGSIRALVIDCKEATHALHSAEGVETAPLYRDFAAVVRHYRRFVLAEQANRYAELPGRRS